MSTSRTRAQKIQSSLRRHEDSTTAPTNERTATNLESESKQPDQAASYAYVAQDLRRISWTTLICLLLLLLATLHQSDLPLFQSLGHALHIR